MKIATTTTITTSVTAIARNERETTQDAYFSVCYLFPPNHWAQHTNRQNFV